jgi:uncharacterized protein
MSLKLRIINTIDDIDPRSWNACAEGHPFVQHAFLKSLEKAGAFSINRGVLPRHVLLLDDRLNLLACAPAMLKWGTLREYGPEIRWLQEGIDTGCFAWPKFQVGVPFFPAMGPKLLVRPDLKKQPLQAAMIRLLCRLRQKGEPIQIFNVLHIDQPTANYCRAQGALISKEWHSMWSHSGAASWDAYVGSLHARKRYQLRKERREAEATGFDFRVLRGKQLTDRILSDYFEGHRRVCARYNMRPWLPSGMYGAIADAMQRSVMMMAYFDGEAYMADWEHIQEVWLNPPREHVVSPEKRAKAV